MFSLDRTFDEKGRRWDSRIARNWLCNVITLTRTFTAFLEMDSLRKAQTMRQRLAVNLSSNIDWQKWILQSLKAAPLLYFVSLRSFSGFFWACAGVSDAEMWNENMLLWHRWGSSLILSLCAGRPVTPEWGKRFNILLYSQIKHAERHDWAPKRGCSTGS